MNHYVADAEQLVKVWLHLLPGTTVTENDEGHVVDVVFPDAVPAPETASSPTDGTPAYEGPALESPLEPTPASAPEASAGIPDATSDGGASSEPSGDGPAPESTPQTPIQEPAANPQANSTETEVSDGTTDQQGA